MTANYSYHRTIRKMVVAFGNMFNNIKLVRYDSTGNELEHFLVPIVYGGKEKYVSRLEGDPNLDKKTQVTLPIMSFSMENMKYDSARKLNTNHRNHFTSGTDSLALYNPVPFDFDFTLYAYVRNIEDGAQIVEKILPYFTPDYTISVNLIPELGTIKQLPIILNDVSNEIEYEGDYNTNVRSIIWTLNFTVKGYLYGAISEAKVIKTSITNIINDITTNDIVAFNLSTPGIGNYQIGENVYQGYSLDNTTASGIVKDWSNGTLYVKNVNGNFVSDNPIIGEITNATYNFSSYNINGVVPVQNTQIIVQPNPVTANANGLYTYATSIQEGMNAPVNIVRNSNNEIVFVPPPPPIPDYYDYWHNIDIDLMK